MLSSTRSLEMLDKFLLAVPPSGNSPNSKDYGIYPIALPRETYSPELTTLYLKIYIELCANKESGYQPCFLLTMLPRSVLLIPVTRDPSLDCALQHLTLILPLSEYFNDLPQPALVLEIMLRVLFPLCQIKFWTSRLYFKSSIPSQPLPSPRRLYNKRSQRRGRRHVSASSSAQTSLVVSSTSSDSTKSVCFTTRSNEKRF